MAGGINAALAAKQLFHVSVDWVDVPEDRLRTLKPEQARAIGEAIRADRQYDAIAVTQLPGKDRFLLVDGLHRLEGCRMVGIELVEARLVSANRASRRRQEILSAWARADHDAFDYAAQVAELAELNKGTGQDEDDCSIVLQGARWDEATANALKLHRTNVFRYLKLHRFYSAEQKAALRDAGLAGDLMPLIRLAALPPEDFDAAWVALTEGRASTIAEMLASVALAPVDTWDKQKGKVLTQAKGWQPHQLTELINGLRELRRAMTGEGGA